VTEDAARAREGGPGEKGRPRHSVRAADLRVAAASGILCCPARVGLP